MTTQEEINAIRKSMDATDDFDTYQELSWQLNFLEQALAMELEDFDFNTEV
jgi:hypothetical protein